jgi:UDP-N-acetylglucosamine:LPS N-acetylglucosamine transferase
MRVALLTSLLGEGHTSALKAVESALTETNAGYITQCIDFWDLMDCSSASAIKAGYLRLALNHADHYEKIYRLDRDSLKQLVGSDQLPHDLNDTLKQLLNQWFPHATSLWSSFTKAPNLDQALLSGLVFMHTGRLNGWFSKLSRWELIYIMRQLLVYRLRKRLREFKPDVIVATQIYPAVLMSFLKREAFFKKIPVIGVVTDYGLHKLWVNSGVDHYCLPDELTASLLEKQKPGHIGIHVTGIPVGPEFRRLPDMQQARRQLGLEVDCPTVLITGGMYGIGVEQAVRRLLDDSSVQVVMTVGKQRQPEDWYGALLQHYPGRLKVFEWHNKMSTLYSAADLVVGKPGGMTITETIVCERPFIASHWLNGQELFNVEFLERQGIGMRCAPERLSATVINWLETPGYLEMLRSRCRKIHKPDAAASIVGLVESCVRPAGLSATPRKQRQSVAA